MKQIRVRLFIAVVFLLGLCGVLTVAYVGIPVTLQSNESLARAQVFLCRDSIGEASKEICYQKSVPRLMDRGLSMERAFTVVARILQLDTGYQSCHVLAHLLSGKEVAKDPNNWMEVVTRVPLTICGTGAMHGAFQERFRAESFPNATPQEIGAMVEGVCDPRDSWNPTLLDRSGCMHGMGHLFLYITDANVQKAVTLCAVLGKRPDFDFTQTCYEGVFMQLYQPLEPEDETLIHAIAEKSRDTKRFCAQFTGVVHNACVKETWPVVKNSATDPVEFEALCKQLKDRSAQEYCASGLMYPVIEMLHYDIPTIESFCRGIVDEDLQDICWARTSSKFVWADVRNTSRALSICEDAPERSKDPCWRELISYAQSGIQKRSPQARELCSGMPEPYRSACVTSTDTHI